MHPGNPEVAGAGNAVVFIHDQEEFFPVGLAEKVNSNAPIFARYEDLSRRIVKESESWKIDEILWARRSLIDQMPKPIPTTIQSDHLINLYQKILSTVAEPSRPPVQRQIRALDVIDRGEVSATNKLQIGASELGFSITLLFGSFLTISAIAGSQIIEPLVGWVGVILGLTFMAMGALHK